MTGSMEFFWRDIQTLRGAIRAALSVPHVDIGELREVERSRSFPIDLPSVDVSSDVALIHRANERMTIRMTRDRQTKAWHDNPPSIQELFALPILSRVVV